MNSSLEFPIDGNALCNFMQLHLDGNEILRLKAIETLTNSPAADLGSMWQALQESELLISTAELFNALRNATQIITLDVVSEKDASIQMLIEDGEIVINTLDSKRTG